MLSAQNGLDPYKSRVGIFPGRIFCQSWVSESPAGMLARWNLLACCPSDTLDSQEGSVGHSMGRVAADSGSHGNIWEWWTLYPDLKHTGKPCSEAEEPAQRARSLFCKSHHRALEPFAHPVPCRTEPPADPPSPEPESNPRDESWTPSRPAGSSGTAGLWFGRAEFVVINYPPLGEVPPHPSLLVQGPDLLLLLLSCKKIPFNPVFPEGDDAHSPPSCPLRWGARKFVGRDTQGGCGRQRAGISVPAKPGDPQSLAAHLGPSPASSKVSPGPVTSRRRK